MSDQTSTPNYNNPLISDHPRTAQQFGAITDMTYKSQIASQYGNLATQAHQNVTSMRGGISAEQLINSLILPNEVVDKTEQLDLFQFSKISSETNHHYEPIRYGLSLLLTDQRIIIIDIDQDNTPLLDKNDLPPSDMGTLNQNRVGHEIRESIFFQPVGLSNINSIVVDVSNSSSATQIVERKRSIPIVVGIVLLGVVVTLFLGDFIPFALSLIVAAGFYFYYKQTKFSAPNVYFGQNRILRIGLTDPETQKHAVWHFCLYDHYDPHILINWAANLQKKCPNLAQ